MRNCRETLGILQYNVRKSRKIVMAPFLDDPEVRNYDILAIQEPYRNPYMATSYCPRDAGFHLAYLSEEAPRVCFYISTKFDTQSWRVEHHSQDLCTLHLSLQDMECHIHNVYNPSPQSYTSNCEGTLPQLQRALNAPGKHVIVGDFNLHHPWWNGTIRLT
jgi:hypothetical protein